MSIPLCTVLHMATSLTWHSPPCCIVDTTLLGGTTLPSQVWQHSGITVSSSQNILEREPSLSSQGRDLQMNSIQPEQVRKDWPSWYPTPAKITLPSSKDHLKPTWSIKTVSIWTILVKCWPVRIHIHKEIFCGVKTVSYSLVKTSLKWNKT